MPFVTFPYPNTLDDRDALVIPENASPDMRNVRFHRGYVGPTVGATLFIDEPGFGVSGHPRNLALAQWPTNLGYGYSETLVMLTTTTAYRCNAGSTSWSTTGESYSLSDIPYNRFSIANTLDVLAWSCLDLTSIRYMAGPTIGGLTGSPGARFLTGFNNRIVTGFTNEAGTTYSFRLRWCVNGNPNDWTGIGSGYLELPDNSMGQIRGLWLLGDRCFVPLHLGILELVPTGQATPAFETRVVIRGTGSQGFHAWASAENFGFFVGSDNVFRWDGSRIDTVGEPVRQTLFESFSPAGYRALQGMIVPWNQEYWLMYLEGENAEVLIYDYRADRWYQDVLNGANAFMPYVVRTTGMYSGDLNQGSIALVANDTGQVMRLDDSASDWNGSSRDFFVTTKDFLAQVFDGSSVRPGIDKKNVIGRLYFLSDPNTVVQVGYSTRQGVEDPNDAFNTWHYQTVTCNSDGVGSAWFQIDAQFVRFSFFSTEAFKLRGVTSFEWDESGSSLSPFGEGH